MDNSSHKLMKLSDFRVEDDVELIWSYMLVQINSNITTLDVFLWMQTLKVRSSGKYVSTWFLYCCKRCYDCWSLWLSFIINYKSSKCQQITIQNNNNVWTIYCFFIIAENIKVDGATSLLFWNLYSVKWNKTINVAKTYWNKRDN